MFVACTPKGIVLQHSVLRMVLRRFWEGFWGTKKRLCSLGARLRVVRQHSLLRMVLRRFWEGFWGRVLRRVLRSGLSMGFSVKKGSQKGF